jgi:dihydrodipicolinate synthase/N-acetylneuraminate lyase
MTTERTVYSMTVVGCRGRLGRSAVELANAADGVGVDAIGAPPPTYSKHSEDLLMIEPFGP